MLKKLTQKTALVMMALAALGVILRVMPHPANFVPIAIFSLLGGAILKGKWAFVMPAFVMVISDSILGINKVVPFTWAALIIISLLASRLLSKRLSFESVFFASILATALFYAATTFGVWAMTDYYVRSLSGLAESFKQELPFFKNILLGDIAYGALLYGMYAQLNKRALLKGEIVKPATDKPSAESAVA